MPKPYQHLSYEERILIQAQLTLGFKPSSIASGLGRSPSTVLRQIGRNGCLPRLPVRIAGGYRAPQAERRARRRRASQPVGRRLQPGNAKAATAAEAFAQILNRFEHHKRRSMTYDQGTEMAHHQTLTRMTGVDVYFAHPHTPWERGISENTNGLIRQYLPRGTDLSLFSQEQLDEIAWKLNVRIRKSLGCKCPAELFLPEGTFDFVKYWSQFSNKLSTVALQP